MKILHIITSLELGGAERLLTELVPYQKSKGHFVKVMILSDRGAVFKKELDKRTHGIWQLRTEGSLSFDDRR